MKRQGWNWIVIVPTLAIAVLGAIVHAPQQISVPFIQWLARLVIRQVTPKQIIRLIQWLTSDGEFVFALALTPVLTLGMPAAARRLMTLPEPGERANQYAWAARAWMAVVMAGYAVLSLTSRTYSFLPGLAFLGIRWVTLGHWKPQWKASAAGRTLREGLKWEFLISPFVIVALCLTQKLTRNGAQAAIVLGYLMLGGEAESGEAEKRAGAGRYLLECLFLIAFGWMRGGVLMIALTALETELRRMNRAGGNVMLACTLLGIAAVWYAPAAWAVPVVLLAGGICQKDAFYAAWLPIRARFVRRRAAKGRR